MSEQLHASCPYEGGSTPQGNRKSLSEYSLSKNRMMLENIRGLKDAAEKNFSRSGTTSKIFKKFPESR
jgi:hypothetical protein